MVDTLTKEQRSERMSMIRAKNTTPEIRLRKLVHGMGFRYRLHDKLLPGTPDLVFPSRKAVIFMHGCFWHFHNNCRIARLPKSNIDFWREKLEANRRRDEKNIKSLHDMGWRVMVVRECQLGEKDLTDMIDVLRKFITNQSPGCY